jgi:hypothetical protein
MLWQAEADFTFRMIGGHFALRVTPPEEPWRDVYENLGTGRVAPRRLKSFLDEHEVDVVVVAPGTRQPARRMVNAAVATPPTQVLDTLVYHLDAPRAPASKMGSRGGGTARASRLALTAGTPSRETTKGAAG